MESMQLCDITGFCSQRRLASEYQRPSGKDAGAWCASVGLLWGSALSFPIGKDKNWNLMRSFFGGFS